jgi:hypothetical protein
MLTFASCHQLCATVARMFAPDATDADSIEARNLLAERFGGRLAPDQTFPRHRIEQLLGQGGMGQVYQGYDTLLQRRVALKVVTTRATEARPDRSRRLGA